MFTDSEATPARVEMLVELVRKMSGRKLDMPTIRQLLQPDGLPGLTAKSDQARSIVAAARELNLIEDVEGMVRASGPRGPITARSALIAAIDENILSDTKVEPWFALFYAFLLGRNESAAGGPEAGKMWEARFERELFGGVTQKNRFNDTKYRGLRRWFRYSGLGWHDGDDRFHPSPYERVLRQIPNIFKTDVELSIDLFMERLSERCPELDGGHLFLTANPDWIRSHRSITLGLSHALVDLHLDNRLVLHCPIDSDGWSIAAAAPPRDGTHLKSDLVSSVRIVNSHEVRNG
ncbi:hypothetical protein HFO17_12030 [Rhizobium laguerreae]|uniref:hypothetical protein n=1 Tax=Rhizobium laguerreae TaxID=1076926 RepID=UPI001C91D637|nr:hypothetical protein [Rhizobium laguerreae]MBY3235265.1 hypothetical protein [Rhizobium laguerreae]